MLQRKRCDPFRRAAYVGGGKIRLAAAGKLPEGWQAARGTTMKGSFDSRCCKFLHIDYAALGLPPGTVQTMFESSIWMKAGVRLARGD